jgi:sec-independent protein translocase protein TatA
MGLFGLGAPELAIIAGVALLVLGPEQVKKLAKDVGKVSAELKQVPEEFSKGMEMGKEELESKKSRTVAPMLSSPAGCAAEPHGNEQRRLFDHSPPSRSL